MQLPPQSIKQRATRRILIAPAFLFSRVLHLWIPMTHLSRMDHLCKTQISRIVSKIYRSAPRRIPCSRHKITSQVLCKTRRSQSWLRADRKTRVVHPLAHQILTKSPLFTSAGARPRITMRCFCRVEMVPETLWRLEILSNPRLGRGSAANKHPTQRRSGRSLVPATTQWSECECSIPTSK